MAEITKTRKLKVQFDMTTPVLDDPVLEAACRKLTEYETDDDFMAKLKDYNSLSRVPKTRIKELDKPAGVYRCGPYVFDTAEIHGGDFTMPPWVSRRVKWGIPD